MQAEIEEKMSDFFKKNTGRIKNYQRTTFEGRSFHSKIEAAHFANLLLLKKARKVSDIRCQKHIKLTKANILYIVDFVVFDEERQCDVYHEVKGFETAEWLLKKRLWRHYGPGILEIYGGSYQRISLTETIVPELE